MSRAGLVVLAVVLLALVVWVRGLVHDAVAIAVADRDASSSLSVSLGRAVR